MKKFVQLFLSLVFVAYGLPASAELLARDMDANGTTDSFYDTTLDLTWLADANYAKTTSYNSDGRMQWFEAKTFAENVVISGFDDWRLPTAVYGGGLNLVGSEMGHLFSVDGFAGIVNVNYNDYGLYWSGTPFGSNPNAFYFQVTTGFQEQGTMSAKMNAMLVRDGDVLSVTTAVPEPETYAMMLAGLGLMGSIARRRKAKQTAQ